MRNLLSKFIVGVLTIVLSSNLLINSVNAATNSSDMNYSLSSLSQETIKKADKYVEIKDGKFVLNNEIYNDNSISVDDINKVNNSINNTNYSLEKSGKEVVVNTKNNSIEVTYSNEELLNKLENSGYNLENEISNDDISTFSAGVNKIEYFWWGFYLYVDSYWTSLALKIAVASLAVLLAEAFPAVSPYTLAIAGAIVDHVLSNSAHAQRGCVISYNYAFGVQDVWVQY